MGGVKRAKRNLVRTGLRLCPLLLFLIPSGADAQILNTLRAFGATEHGWSGEIGGFFSATGGNTENTSLTGSFRVQRIGDVHHWKLLGDASRTSSKDEVTEESTVLHARHNAKLSSRFSSVAFLQHQHDRFQRLTARYLVGAGVRWLFVDRESLEGAFGITPMLEAERIVGRDTKTLGRLSSFVSIVGRLNERTTVDVSAFAQPKLDDAEDLRSVGTASIKFVLTGRWSLIWNGRVSHDSRPAPGVERTDWKTRTGLSVSL